MSTCQFRSWASLGNGLSKGCKVLKCHDNPAALGRVGNQRGTGIKLLSPCIIQRQCSPGAGQFSPGPVCSGAHNRKSPAQMFYSFSWIRKQALGSIPVAAWLLCPAQRAGSPPSAGFGLFPASKEVSDLGGLLPRQQILLATDISFSKWEDVLAFQRSECPGKPG